MLSDKRENKVFFDFLNSDGKIALNVLDPNTMPQCAPNIS